MIRQLRGSVIEQNLSSVVLDVGGVGYLISMTLTQSGALPVGTESSIYTYLAVRENALDLYGFLTREDLDMFELLIDLPKIGPKTALQIMSQADTELLRKSTLSQDALYLSKMSGIGKKTAEKIVIGLKEKFGDDGGIGVYGGDGDADVIDALIILGYSQKEARDAIQKIGADITGANARIKEALRLLGKQ